MSRCSYRIQFRKIIVRDGLSWFHCVKFLAGIYLKSTMETPERYVKPIQNQQ